MNINIDCPNATTLDRLEELVLHVINISENDSRFGSTKLNKVVFRIDLEVFCRTGRTITGATYQKEKYGPVPRAMPIVLSRLEQDKRIEIVSVPVQSKVSKRPKGKARADLSAFSPRDLEVVAKVVSENFGKTGSKMSDETHMRLAYKAFKMGETIPFAAWLVEGGKVTARDKEMAETLEAKARAFHERASSDRN